MDRRRICLSKCMQPTPLVIYTETIDLQQIGVLDVSRASEIEFNPDTQQWEVFDYTGVRVFTDPSRETCLRWEREYFNHPHTT